MNEIWKDIKGYEGYYQVSNFGKVRSLNRSIYRKNGRKQSFKDQELKFHDKHGYLGINLRKDGKIKSCTVHRLVAEAFIPNPYNLPQINHKDENKYNNRIDNLEWCSSSYNMNYGTRTYRSIESCKKTMKEKFENGYESPFKGKHHTEETKVYLSEINSGDNHPQARSIICITTGIIFNTTKEGAEYYNCDASGITKCCKNKRKSSGKLKDGTPLVWKYYECKKQEVTPKGQIRIVERLLDKNNELN